MDVGAGLTQALFGYGLTIVVAGAASCLIWLIVITLERMKEARKPAKAAAPAEAALAAEAAPAPVDDTDDIVAAISGAVYATLGAHRLVYIGEPATARTWATTGRTLHQTSHLPKRSPSG